MLDACAERDRRAHNDRAWLAHQTAFLTSYHPPKPERFTKLDRLQIKAKKGAPAHNRDWQDDFAAMSAWASKSVH
ncbi:hypothetical protein [Devosia aurantiaca]|uniref:Uncharacterized protein n=1 Tax=Devosia aurantiaca TaxID=2714858 RepID=A0A6M1SRW5_9HYPH|nr:hypothetical protein [Devosia aurantiaca]NGP19296.1 hypothetical protein [Devosia aurantiaca]